MNHLDERRWRTIDEDELTPEEADHLGACSACQSRWESAIELPMLERLHQEAPPVGLLSATLASFDRAWQARARRRRSRALLGICMIWNLVGWALMAWLFSERAGLLSQLSALIGRGWTVLGVMARLSLHFPTFAVSNACALTVSGLVLAWFWTHLWRTSSRYAAK